MCPDYKWTFRNICKVNGTWNQHRVLLIPDKGKYNLYELKERVITRTTGKRGIWVWRVKLGEAIRLVKCKLFINGCVIELIKTLILEYLLRDTMSLIMVGNGVFWFCSPQKVFNNQHWISIKSHLAVKPNWIPDTWWKPNQNWTDPNRPRNCMARTWCKNYHEWGKRRCDKNFGTFPVLRISSYGKFFTMTILHKPIRPVTSGTCPSDDNFPNVCSSTNITKQTFFLEYSLICIKGGYIIIT